MTTSIIVTSSNFNSIDFDHVYGFKVASGGAMGSPGHIEIFTGVGRCYDLNYVVNPSLLNRFRRSFPEGATLLDGNEVEGWASLYLGMGNMLFVRKEILTQMEDVSTDIAGDMELVDKLSELFDDSEIMRKAKETKESVSMAISGLVLDAVKNQIASSSKLECLHVAIDANGKLTDTISKDSSDMGARFLLGEPGDNPLIVFGINPSTAVSIDGDQTIRKVKRIAESKQSKRMKCNGWIMLNLYPQRTPKPKKLPYDGGHNQDYIDANEAVIKDVLNRYKSAPLLAAWGNNVHMSKRAYLVQCRNRIIDLSHDRTWLCVDELTKKGNPRHPLFADPENIGFLTFENGIATRMECH